LLTQSNVLEKWNGTKVLLILADRCKGVTHVGSPNGLAGTTRVLMVPVSLLHFTEVLGALVATVIIVVFIVTTVIIVVFIVTTVIIVVVAPAITSLLKGRLGRVRNRAGHCHLRSKRKESSKNVEERFHFEKK
jgi:hypothetical protein